MGNTKAEQARNLRFKRAIVEGFNLDGIRDELYEISSQCADIRWIAEGDEDTLIAALDGSEEDAYEFRMMFSDLDCECEQISNLLDDEYVTEYFDEFFCRVAGGCVNVLGYDTVEEDYFKLTGYEGKMAQKESEKRLLRLTKQELLNAAEQCFGIASAFLNVRFKFDYLKATFDIIRDENTSYLETIKGIEKAYEKAAEQDFRVYSKETREFERLVAELPPRAWLE